MRPDLLNPASWRYPHPWRLAQERGDWFLLLDRYGPIEGGVGRLAMDEECASRRDLHRVGEGERGVQPAFVGGILVIEVSLSRAVRLNHQQVITGSGVEPTGQSGDWASGVKIKRRQGESGQALQSADQIVA